MFCVPAVNGMLFLGALVLQVQYMTDFKSGEKLVYSNVCGLIAYHYTMKIQESIGNGNPWMALLQRRLLGEKGTGPNPTDRSKSGTKRSILVDGNGVPLSMAVDGANRHDMKMTKATLQSIVVHRPEPTVKSQQHMCMDKGYDYPEVYELLEDYGYSIHIRLRGGGEEHRINSKRLPRYRAKRWVVERTHSWMNRFRRLLIRWEKKVENYVAMLHFACAWITYRRGGLFA
jgi:putative transposase